ncbi:MULTISPECIES: aminoglycoside phosphotransferase family protein [unclassified Microbacterium]|uniref:aminoglycoside phosphotransferase family protein n=1 Tax=unclassified Microbacterium TaxID=2609290 RepID=UPI000EA95C97|nr:MULTISPECIES: aminoglycoside phosphotransferase family protein [unclassified Microbacterium]MBT2486218.1 aminoglycoside phosphotransferase family protein [Microbacterium sp. ISL-108]RKN68938.1 aminoglycoside phosphotransferase family protein [Microbacterium sp. CGR2]
MVDKPAADIRIDETLVRALVTSHAARLPQGAAALPLEKVAEGWDSELWRLGPHLAVRLPRREPAAVLVLNEQRALPGIATRIAPTGLLVPAPLVVGIPSAQFPWPWSVVPWMEGVSGIDVPREHRAGWAEPLAAALHALHIPAPSDHPVNPVRGRALSTRDTVFGERLEALRRAELVDSATATVLEQIWRRGVTAPIWSAPAVWIHGDLHPGNLVSRDDALLGIIDFGDVTAGDPAYDLAVAWLAFDASGRERFRTAIGTQYDAETWKRAHAWAAAIGVLLLAHSDDAPAYQHAGYEAIAEVVDDGLD